MMIEKNNKCCHRHKLLSSVLHQCRHRSSRCCCCCCCCCFIFFVFTLFKFISFLNGAQWMNVYFSRHHTHTHTVQTIDTRYKRGETTLCRLSWLRIRTCENTYSVNARWKRWEKNERLDSLTWTVFSKASSACRTRSLSCLIVTSAIVVVVVVVHKSKIGMGKLCWLV